MVSNEPASPHLKYSNRERSIMGNEDKAARGLSLGLRPFELDDLSCW